MKDAQLLSITCNRYCRYCGKMCIKKVYTDSNNPKKFSYITGERLCKIRYSCPSYKQKWWHGILFGTSEHDDIILKIRACKKIY